MSERRMPFKQFAENLLRQVEYTEEVKRCGDCEYCIAGSTQYFCITHEMYKIPIKLEGRCQYFKI